MMYPRGISNVNLASIYINPCPFTSVGDRLAGSPKCFRKRWGQSRTSERSCRGKSSSLLILQRLSTAKSAGKSSAAWQPGGRFWAVGSLWGSENCDYLVQVARGFPSLQKAYTDIMICGKITKWKDGWQWLRSLETNSFPRLPSVGYMSAPNITQKISVPSERWAATTHPPRHRLQNHTKPRHDRDCDKFSAPHPCKKHQIRELLCGLSSIPLQ